ncbi:NUDIX hydrolase [Oleiagrimonas sp. C23AA]|uniref:NUDIX hydrolase n=1 Tax=Oleiagrimonas sp. C23AA TaxID=2719047 RepID=UPI0014221DD5|nr:NUDIX hydrolase [Oleiagrimonas sp. C23AA]NII11566.1 NUDIX hydrolase [Oleiagrimonas sp. C23AA]
MSTHDIPEDANATVETLYQGRWLALRRKGRWEYAERTNPGAVIIVALTPENKLLFVEQFRVPIGQRTIEMPAGLVGDLDDADESPLKAAARELEEETGYRCDSVRFLHEGPSSAGMSTEMVRFVHAIGLTRVGAGGGDATEDITVHEVPLEQAGAWLLEKTRQGYSIDPKLFAGLWCLEHADLFERADH